MYGGVGWEQGFYKKTRDVKNSKGVCQKSEETSM
jgi:hypothetical protein